jgi:hypothetical protein
MANPNKEPEFSEEKRCGHCGNFAPMKKVAKFDDTKTHFEDNSDDPHSSFAWSEGDCYELLKCPACGKIELRSYYYHDMYDEQRPLNYKTLYPVSSKLPLGLPLTIQKEYEAALKVRSISANAYGVLMGRVLELVCEDRTAKGKDLFQRLADLATKGEIPSKLVAVADKLRTLRNVGAHAVLGELTEKEVPILESLSRAILEYVYSAPFLVEQANDTLEKLKRRKKVQRNK